MEDAVTRTLAWELRRVLRVWRSPSSGHSSTLEADLRNAADRLSAAHGPQPRFVSLHAKEVSA